MAVCLLVCLDASKTFDRVNHCILFSKLGNRGTPNILFAYCLSGMLTSRCAYVGVGHLLSSMYLMASDKAAFSRLIYSTYIIDDLSLNINACRVGCCVGIEIINHLMYADDLVIMAPSVAGLSKLLRICASPDGQKKIERVCIFYLYNTKMWPSP